MNLRAKVRVKSGQIGEVRAICHDYRTGEWEVLVHFDVEDSQWYNKLDVEEL